MKPVLKPVYTAADIPESLGVVEQPKVAGIPAGNITARKGEITSGRDMKIYYEDHYRYFGSFTKHPYTNVNPKPQGKEQ